MKLYRGYVLTKNKRPIQKFRNGENLMSYEEVKDNDEYAGVLADDVVLVDIDNEEQSEILMNIVEDLQLDCFVRLTSRGRHFLFKNNGITQCYTGVKLACGLTADIKVGCKNTIQVLKFKGEERWEEWDCEEPQDIPKWLFPVNTSANLFNMADGEGRNSTLYGYILPLMKSGLNKEEIKECINIINTYIFKHPLPKNEIETILRDESFPEAEEFSRISSEQFFGDNNNFLHNKFAEFLKEEANIKRINGQLHVFKDGVYVPGMRFIESNMIKYIPTLKANQRVETLKYLEIICPEDEEAADAKYIAFNNGVYDITTGNLKEFSPDLIMTNKIPWDYNPVAYSEIADKTLNKIACNDADIRSVLEESIGYSFYRRNEMSKSFFLTGEGSNGKSTFLEMLINVIGPANRASLGLEELDERFSVATLSNKLINAGDDISDEFWTPRCTASFRKLVSGNEVKGEFKGQDAFFMKTYAKFFFSANALPRVRSKAFEAVKRRMVIIPFNAKFSKTDADFDPYISWKLKDKEVMEYLIVLGIKGLNRVLANNGFTESKKVQKEIEEYEIENNPILLFLQEYGHEIDNQPTKDVLKKYKMFCVENGFQEMSLSSLSKELNKRAGYVVKRTRIDGNQIGIYVKGK